jgi:hypothetical protein
VNVTNHGFGMCLTGAVGLKGHVVSLILTVILTVFSALPATASVQSQSIEHPTILNEKSFSAVVDEATRLLGPTEHPVNLHRIVGMDESLAISQLSQDNRLVLINPHRMLFDDFGFINTGEFLATTLQLHGRREAKAAISATTVHVSEHGYIALMTPGVTSEGLIVASVTTSASDPQQRILLDLMSDGLVRYAILQNDLGQLTGVDGEAVARASSETEPSGHMLINARSAADIQRAAMNTANVAPARRLVVQNGSIRLEAEPAVQASAKPSKWPSPQNVDNTGQTQNGNSGKMAVVAAAAAPMLNPGSGDSHRDTARETNTHSTMRDDVSLRKTQAEEKRPAVGSNATPIKPSHLHALRVETKGGSKSTPKAPKSASYASAHQPKAAPSAQGALPEWMKYLPKTDNLSENAAIP